MRKVASWGTIKFRGEINGVIEELRTIGGEIGGESHTRDIVTYARNNPDSELYKCFDWDVQSAAEKHWLYTARQIVRNINVTYIDDEANKEPVTVRWFYKNERTGGYKETTIMIQKVDEYSKLLEMAKSELRAFKKKYATLVELDAVFNEIDAL